MRHTVLLPALGVALLAGTSLARAQTVETVVTPAPMVIAQDPVLVTAPAPVIETMPVQTTETVRTERSTSPSGAKDGARYRATACGHRNHDANHNTRKYCSCADASGGGGDRSAGLHRGRRDAASRGLSAAALRLRAGRSCASRSSPRTTAASRLPLRLSTRPHSGDRRQHGHRGAGASALTDVRTRLPAPPPLGCAGVFPAEEVRHEE